jgi:hypothetical protein
MMHIERFRQLSASIKYLLLYLLLLSIVFGEAAALIYLSVAAIDAGKYSSGFLIDVAAAYILLDAIKLVRRWAASTRNRSSENHRPEPSKGKRYA